jgi:hypothetical protein
VTLAFRNLTISPGAPVSLWPTEAVQTALERGDRADWHRIVAEIQADPWGKTARQVEEVLSHSRPYGIAEAMETVLSRARERAEAAERAEVAAEITEAVRRSGMSRAMFASRTARTPGRGRHPGGSLRLATRSPAMLGGCSRTTRSPEFLRTPPRGSMITVLP